MELWITWKESGIWHLATSHSISLCGLHLSDPVQPTIQNSPPVGSIMCSECVLERYRLTPVCPTPPPNHDDRTNTAGRDRATPRSSNPRGKSNSSPKSKQGKKSTAYSPSPSRYPKKAGGQSKNRSKPQTAIERFRNLYGEEKLTQVRLYKPSYMGIFDACEFAQKNGIEKLKELHVEEMRAESRRKEDIKQRSNPNPSGASHTTENPWKAKWNLTHRRW